jgi:hypothetical protein
MCDGLVLGPVRAVKSRVMQGVKDAFVTIDRDSTGAGSRTPAIPVLPTDLFPIVNDVFERLFVHFAHVRDLLPKLMQFGFLDI